MYVCMYVCMCVRCVCAYMCVCVYIKIENNLLYIKYCNEFEYSTLRTTEHPNQNTLK